MSSAFSNIMELTTGKPNLLSNILVRLLSFFVLVFLARFGYLVTRKPNACDSVDFCFFFSAASNGYAQISGEGDGRLRNYYSSVFQDLIAEGYLSPNSKTLCIETLTGEDVAALKEIGVSNSVGISTKPSPEVIYGRAVRQPFGNNTFDFEFSGDGSLDRSSQPVKFASEISRTLKLGGFFVVHTAAKDAYSLDSLLDLFASCRLIRYRDIDSLDSSIREVVLMKENQITDHGHKILSIDGNSGNKCPVPGYKRELIRNAEPLISEEPLKPWITLKRNRNNIRYLPSVVDISFKHRYVYIDVGARSYGSSIGSWFQKQYPKQNKTFEIYAISANKAFHKEIRTKKRFTLLPYAAWVRNETLFFEITREPTRKNEDKFRGMGRVQAVQPSSNFVGDSDRIEGFDFADWLKNAVSERDFVVVKMNVEGSEFHLVPRLVETGAICLVDEMLVECHYNRWQRCCPGKRSSKHQKTFAQCLVLFSSLRESGVLVHQWW
ncbi:uncharacterized protein LOC130773791 [Actinidia eriantha]|uniref:uncharacterized protein LOC130773791 n=1 Tax=Actinidia eriantha TaxID=165200 RepID=UPI00258A8248|nr:uncharacterized protein LOC130773791 [Actinidia eriantha]